MNAKGNPPARITTKGLLLEMFVDALIAFVILGFLLVAGLMLMTPLGTTLIANLNWLFAADSVQLWWYVTRAAGIIAYLLLWFSMVWGLGVASKIFDKMLDRPSTYDFHEFISLLAIGFTLLHILVLALDRYLPYSTVQILIPFLSPYRPLWVGIGVISFYIVLLVTVTFYLRSRIGSGAFRAIHTLSLLSYVGVTLHGLYAGTDAALPAMQLLYAGTGLVVIFLTVYWLVMLIQRRAQNVMQPGLPNSQTSARVR
jgi:sulfoxide reductase heme-binding subunit YedZ